ncbi:MAG: helix-turn-helix transcriptional regulator [Duncaniella sp.]|nr:helix-turn-helix transcriptional regulator [Duncaniella sp.]
MADAARSIDNEDEIISVKKIVLKVLRYMETNHLSQKELAELLGVSPQYINKFLHGQDDIKVSTALRYGKILGIKLIEIPEETVTTHPIVVYQEKYILEIRPKEHFGYNRHNYLYIPVNKKQYAYN